MIGIGASAQDEKHELSVGVGFGTTGEIYDAVSNIGWAFVNCEDESKGFTGAINLDYGYHVSPKLVVTGTVSFARLKDEMYNKKDHSYAGSSRNTYIAIMPGVKYNWLNKSKVAVYSRASVGVHLIDINDEIVGSTDDSGNGLQATIAYQVSPIGIEAGGKLRGYAELGFGATGIISAGLRYKF